MNEYNDALDTFELEEETTHKDRTREGEIGIWLKNHRSGVTATEELLVVPDTTLGEILECAYEMVGLNRATREFHFRTPKGKDETNLKKKVKELELEDGDTLSILDHGGVA